MSTKQRMRESWDRFARDDPFRYVASERDDWTAAEFLESGERAAGSLIDWIGDRGARGQALELGCGPGRLLHHFARHYDRVTGLDVSPRMLDLARSLDPPPNVELVLGDGAGLDPLPDAGFDLVYSIHVFQHIPDPGLVRSYLSEVERVLRPGGHAVLQFDTRPYRSWERVAFALPDAVLPALNRSHIRRYRLDARKLKLWLADAGLDLLDERHPAGANHLLLLAKPRA